jgi:hypothetical protein
MLCSRPPEGGDHGDADEPDGHDQVAADVDGHQNATVALMMRATVDATQLSSIMPLAM